MKEVIEKLPTEIDERILEHGVRIVTVVQVMPKTFVGRRIGDQLLPIGLSVGASFEKAQAAESQGDFVRKLQIALKQLRESAYWLQVASKSGLLPPKKLAPLLEESGRLVRVVSKAAARAEAKGRGFR